MNQQTQKQPAESPAEIYEYHMVPAIFAPWVPALLGLAAPQIGERFLDVACGTGVVARHAVSRIGPTGRVVGLDMNPKMLDMARARGPSVEWKEGDAQALPFADREFDMVVCQQGLQFFPNRDVALREMHRVLAPGGRLALALWSEIESSPGHDALAQGLERHIGPEAAALRAGLRTRPCRRALRMSCGPHLPARYPRIAGLSAWPTRSRTTTS